jgi:Domain of unknown function (DUF4407)
VSKDLGRWLRWLGCADESILAHCPIESMRFAATGATVLTTSGLAALSATLTAHQFLHIALLGALLVGVGWGVAIMALDRWLILSIRRQASSWATLALALPRVLLAIVAGLVIAKPLVLTIFRSEVTAQATADRQHAYLLQRQRLDDQYATIGTLSTQASSIEQELTKVDIGSVLLTDPEYGLANQQAQNLQARSQAAEQQALCELDGTCGTHHVGSGPVYAVKQATANQLQARAATAQAKLATLRQSLLAQQTARQGQDDRYLRAQLTQILHRRDQLAAQRTQDEATLRSVYREPLGLAERLDALSEVSRQHPSVAAMSLLITLLILLIDSAPALGKAFTSIGMPTLYEQVQSEEEQSLIERARAHRRALADAHAHEAAAIVDEAAIRRRLWKRNLTPLVGRQVRTQVDLAEHYIDRWSEDARAGMDDWIQASLRERLTDRAGVPSAQDLSDAARSAPRNGGAPHASPSVDG